MHREQINKNRRRSRQQKLLEANRRVGHSNNKIVIICPLCAKKKNTVLGLHGIPYYKCSNCQHIFIHAKKNGIIKHTNLYRKKKFIRNNWINTNIFTSNYYNYEEKMAKSREKTLSRYADSSSNILLIEAKSGFILNSIEKKYNYVIGICSDSFYKQLWNSERLKKSDIYSFSDKHLFDIVYIYDYVQYQDCLYRPIIKTMSMIKKRTGKLIIDIPVDLNVKDDHLMSVHNFTKESANAYREFLSNSSSIDIDKNLATIVIDYWK